MDLQQFIYNIAKCLPGLVSAIVVHEAAHAYMAFRFGDDTAKRMGRLSLNPAVHYDLLGTVIFPLVGAMSGFAFGWAKPVPIDTRNFTDYRKGLFWVSFAGPLSNFILGTLAAFFLALIYTKTTLSTFGYRTVVLEMLNYSILINFILAGFNLIPLPPLDGSKMLAAVLRNNALRRYEDFSVYASYLLWALILLSFAGIPVLGYMLLPFQYMANVLKFLFVYLLGSF